MLTKDDRHAYSNHYHYDYPYHQYGYYPEDDASLGEDDGGLNSQKQISASRFYRNHMLIAEVFSDKIMPDVRSVVTNNRLEVLRRQAESLIQHQERSLNELTTMEENFSEKKRKILDSSEEFRKQLEQLSKPAVADAETYQQMFEKALEQIKAQNEQQQKEQKEQAEKQAAAAALENSTSTPSTIVPSAQCNQESNQPPPPPAAATPEVESKPSEPETPPTSTASATPPVSSNGAMFHNKIGQYGQPTPVPPPPPETNTSFNSTSTYQFNTPNSNSIYSRSNITNSAHQRKFSHNITVFVYFFLITNFGFRWNKLHHHIRPFNVSQFIFTTAHTTSSSNASRSTTTTEWWRLSSL